MARRIERTSAKGSAASWEMACTGNARTPDALTYSRTRRVLPKPDLPWTSKNRACWWAQINSRERSLPTKGMSCVSSAASDISTEGR